LAEDTMIFWERADGKGMIKISDEKYQEALDLGWGCPSVAWSDDEVLEFLEDPEAFKEHMLSFGTSA